MGNFPYRTILLIHLNTHFARAEMHILLYAILSHKKTCKTRLSILEQIAHEFERFFAESIEDEVKRELIYCKD